MEEMNLKEQGIITIENSQLPAVVHANFQHAVLNRQNVVFDTLMNAFKLNPDNTVMDTGMYCLQGRIGYINKMTNLAEMCNSGNGFYQISIKHDLSLDTSPEIEVIFRGQTNTPLSFTNNTCEYGFASEATSIGKMDLYMLERKSSGLMLFSDFRKFEGKEVILCQGNFNNKDTITMTESLDNFSYFKIVFGFSSGLACMGILAENGRELVGCLDTATDTQIITNIANLTTTIKGSKTWTLVRGENQPHNVNGNHGNRNPRAITKIIGVGRK